MARQDGNGKQLCPCQCHWDFSWLRFGDSKISAGDVDGLFVVERRGHFLYWETKNPDEGLAAGQRILLEQLSLVSVFTVLLVRGKGYPETLQRVRHGKFGDAQETSREDFQRRVDAWYEAVMAL